MSEVQLDVQALLDREAIRDVIYTYCRAADRRDLDLFKSCYHPGATDQHAFFSGPADKFCEHAMEQLYKCRFSMHRISNIRIKLNGDRAFVESYVVVVHRVKRDGEYVDFDNFGRYCDIFEKRDGVWKILHRTHLPDGDRIIRVEELAGRPSDLDPDNASFEMGRAGPDDASYFEFDLIDRIRHYDAIQDLWEHHMPSKNASV